MDWKQFPITKIYPSCRLMHGHMRGASKISILASKGMAQSEVNKVGGELQGLNLKEKEYLL